MPANYKSVEALEQLLDRDWLTDPPAFEASASSLDAPASSKERRRLSQWRSWLDTTSDLPAKVHK